MATFEHLRGFEAKRLKLVRAKLFERRALCHLGQCATSGCVPKRDIQNSLRRVRADVEKAIILTVSGGDTLGLVGRCRIRSRDWQRSTIIPHHDVNRRNNEDGQ